MTESELPLWLGLWLATAAYLLVRHWASGRGAGLVLTYVLSYGAIHWLAAALYALPWYNAPAIEVTAIGLRVAALGMVAFALGGELGLLLSHRYGRPPAAADDSGASVAPRTATLYLVMGVLAYVVVAPVASSLPTIGAFVSTTSSLMVLGVGLKAWNGWQAGRRTVTWAWLITSTTFPAMTLLGQGFLGFGFAAMLIVVAFVASFYRPRWIVIVAGVLVTYLGISVYVTYMRDRRDIRSVVWGGEAMSARLETLAAAFSDFEWFDLTRIEHLRRIDERLNQDALVGAAVQGIESEAVPLAMGGTLVDAVVALVPRAIWPNKPVEAGSGNVVSDYTGLRFVDGTSVGIGHVMEWYINFAMPGLWIGLAAFGAALVFIDRTAAAYLREGDAGRFALWFLPGTSLLGVGGSFVETSASAAASLLLAWVLLHVTARWDDLARPADDDASRASGAEHDWR
ncbi:MAG: hypothetical protein ABS36_11215 [Acidobacteria bacterium SCN 69-37]|nr:MAG: hypothetical protein ABS36_11215 [Acidobacteria bacterium SCN 69-37]